MWVSRPGPPGPLLQKQKADPQLNEGPRGERGWKTACKALMQVPPWIPAAGGKNTPSVRNDLSKKSSSDPVI